MGEDAPTNNKSAVPVLVSQLFDTEPDWNEMEFLIKWKGQSHLHCQWKTLSDLQNVHPWTPFLILCLIYLLHIFVIMLFSFLIFCFVPMLCALAA